MGIPNIDSSLICILSSALGILLRSFFLLRVHVYQSY